MKPVVCCVESTLQSPSHVLAKNEHGFMWPNISLFWLRFPQLLLVTASCNHMAFVTLRELVHVCYKQL